MPTRIRILTICAVMISLLPVIFVFQLLLRMVLDSAATGADARSKARCDAFVAEGFEIETRWSAQVGCMAKRTDGWERL